MGSSSSEYSEISDEYDVSLSELSKSSESSSEEEIGGKGKAPPKKKKTVKGDEVNYRTTTRTKKKKSQDKSLNASEMEELTSWIYSTEEAIKVEDHLRSTLLSDPRIKIEGKRFAEHLSCDTEKQHFQLLVTGFCRTFSTLTEEAFRSNIPSYRKAAFAVAWMKFLCNFHPGKATQERMIVERILKSAKPHFESQSVHSVLSVLHELIYSFIQDRVPVKKADGETTGAGETGTQLKEETDDVLYRYCGASLHRMIKLREETLTGKKGRGELSVKRRSIMSKELEILRDLVAKDKSNIPSSLKSLDEGNLIFPRIELLPFLRSVDNEVREFATDSNLKYPKSTN